MAFMCLVLGFLVCVCRKGDALLDVLVDVFSLLFFSEDLRIHFVVGVLSFYK